jgi:hypothetical protein
MTNTRTSIFKPTKEAQELNKDQTKLVGEISKEPVVSDFRKTCEKNGMMHFSVKVRDVAKDGTLLGVKIKSTDDGQPYPKLSELQASVEAYPSWRMLVPFRHFFWPQAPVQKPQNSKSMYFQKIPYDGSDVLSCSMIDNNPTVETIKPKNR